MNYLAHSTTYYYNKSTSSSSCAHVMILLMHKNLFFVRERHLQDCPGTPCQIRWTINPTGPCRSRLLRNTNTVRLSLRFRALSSTMRLDISIPNRLVCGCRRIIRRII